MTHESDEFQAIAAVLDELPHHRARLATIATVALHELCRSAQAEGVTFDFMLEQLVGSLRDAFAAVADDHERQHAN